MPFGWTADHRIGNATQLLRTGHACHDPENWSLQHELETGLC